MLARIVAVLSVAALFGVLAPMAAAEGTVVCPPDGGPCIVEVETPGSGGTPGEGGTRQVENPGSSEQVCRDLLDRVVKCYDPFFGWWNPENRCHYRLADPQPAQSHPIWEGNTDGAIYVVVCGGIPGVGGGWEWRASPPPGFGGGGPTPAELAARAIDRLNLGVPAIGMAPEPGKTGLVGLPVWLWLEDPGSTWAPRSATASVPGLSVTATATAVKVEWSMGDGTTVTCTTPGVVYTGQAGDSASPECGHRYTVPSATQPGGAYTVTATTTWDIQWAGGGASGQLAQTRSSSLPVRIGELQVLVS